MDGINFCEPSLVDRLKEVRLVVACIAIVALLGAIESIRIAGVLEDARALELRRDALAVRVHVVQERAKAIRERQIALDAALHFRQSSAALALNIARIGNALSSSIALTSMRGLGSRVEIEGRSPSLGGVRRTLQTLARPALGQGEGKDDALEIRRDETSPGWVAFRVAFAPSPEGTSR